MSLDYIVVSETLADRVTDYRVVKNKNTEIASDHHPVVAELKHAKVASSELRIRAIDQTWFNFEWDFKKIW